MQKNCYVHSVGLRGHGKLKQIFLVMRLIVFFLTAALMNVQAKSVAQNITLNGRSLTLEEVFAAIKQQTDYLILYSDPVMKLSQPVSITAKNVPLEKFLSDVFKSQPRLKYSIKGKSIFITEKAPPAINDAGQAELFEEPAFVPVKGRVVDSAGTALQGASVAVKNKRMATTTDAQGVFSVDIEKGDVLVITFVGYETQQVKVTEGLLRGAAPFTIQLRPVISSLEEVAIVNTGYQKLNRTNVTGAVAFVDAGQLEKRNVANIMQNLEGAVPGLVQYRNVATIRGVSTLQANANILVVVDGLPIEGSINDLNPYDVESVSVLKDAAAASIYGARASNGVIVVTTRRAKERNKTTVELSGNTTITNKPDWSYYNYMTPAQQVDWESNYYNWYFSGGPGPIATVSTAFENSIANGSAASPVQYAYYQRYKPSGAITQAQLEATLAELKKGNFAQQYRHNALENQVLQQYNLALRTNSGRTQNNLVLNYTTDNLGMKNQYNRVLNLFYKGTFSPARWIDLDYGVNSIIGKMRTHNSSFATNPFNVPSYYNLFNADGSLAYYSTERFNTYNTSLENNPAMYPLKFNHLQELGRDFVNTSVMNTRYYVNLAVRVLPGLTINPMFQYEDNRRNVSAYSEAESYTMRLLQDAYSTRTGAAPNYTYTNLLPKGGKLATSQLRSPNYTARAQANYQREFGKHGFIALAGAEFRQTRTYGHSGILLGYDEQLQLQSTNQVNFAALYNVNLTSGFSSFYPTRQYHFNEVSPIGLTRDEIHRFASGYANLTYVYDRKYNIFGGMRKDYADLFGGDEKYRGKPLWSVGAAWLASNENFMKRYKFLDYLKVRASYGLTGNIRNVTAVLAATTGTNNVTLLPNASVTNPPNPQLRWEKTVTTNIGMDFTLFFNRLRGSLDWYRRVGTDLFAQKRLDPSEGFTSMIVNNASMVNKGFECNLGYDWFKPAKPNGFRWTTSVVGALNRNRITSVDELTRNPLTLAGGGSYKVGYPVRSVFAFRFAGLSSTGLPQWYDSKGVATSGTIGATDADAILFVGDSDPRINISLNNEFAWKGFSLSVFAIYYGGHYFRARPVPLGYPYAAYAPLPSYLLNAWTPGNTNTDVPGSGQYYQIQPTNQYYYSDNLMRPADFIKIRTIVLGYDLPHTIAAKIRASGVRLRFQINNLKSSWIKEKDVHVDPETANGIPLPTSYVFGINANF
jgi:TonB-linked SusC/RagA family outer membrane protein